MEPQQFPGQPNSSEDSGQQLSQPDNSARQTVHNPLAVMQPGEQIICEIKRHPIGMLGTYIMSGFILIVLAVLAFIIIPHMAGSDNQSKALAAGGLIFVVVAVLILVFVFIANKVYWGNHWIVTSDSVTQIIQSSLFSRKSSQLSLGNLEDVTVEQNGIFQQLFKYGTVRAETAGERSKFVFPFCPNPNYYAQKILAAREIFEQVHHGGKQEPYQAPTPPTSPQPSPAGPEPQFQPQFQASPAAPPQSADLQPLEPPRQEPDAASPQYQVGQTPPIFGSQPPSPPAEPTPKKPSGEDSSVDETPSAFPDDDQPFGGVSTNTPVD